MRKSFIKYSLLVAAVAFVVMVLAGCPAAPQPEKKPVKEISLEVTAPTEVYGGQEFKVTLDLDYDFAFPVAYTVNFMGKDVYKDEKVSPGSTQVEFYVTTSDVAKDTKATLSVTVYYIEYPEKFAKKDVEVTLKVNKAPTIEYFSALKDTFEFGVASDTTDKVNVELEFKAYDDVSKTLSYVISGVGEISGEIASGEATKVVIPVSFGEFQRHDYAITFKLVVIDELGKSSYKEFTVRAEVGGALESLTVNPKAAVIGEKVDKLVFSALYKKGEVSPEISNFAWWIADESTTLKEGTVDTDDIELLGEYLRINVTVGREIMEELEATPGKYYFYLSYNDVMGKLVKSAPFYYYKKGVFAGFTFEPDATNNDLSDDIYKGDAALKFTVKINGTKGEYIILDKDIFSYESTPVGGKVELVEKPGTWNELDDYWLVELPASFTFKVDPLLKDSTEVNEATVFVALKFADGYAGDNASKTEKIEKKIDSLNPRFTIDAMKYGPREILVNSTLKESNFATGLIVFYLKDTPIATLDVASYNSEEVEIVKKYFDKTMVTYEWWAKDKVGHEVSGKGDAGEFDTAVGKVTVEWAEDYGDYYSPLVNESSALVIKVVAEDESGVDGKNIKIVHSLTPVATTVEVEQEGTKTIYTYTMKFKDDDVFKIKKESITVTVKDNAGNDYILNAEAKAVKFPSKDLVYDGKAPDLSGVDINVQGEIDLGNPDYYLDKVTVYASMNNIEKKIYEGNDKLIALTAEDFIKAGFENAPNGDLVDFTIYAVDKAGNEASWTTMKEGREPIKIDVVFPEVNFKVEENIGPDSGPTAKIRIYQANKDTKITQINVITANGEGAFAYKIDGNDKTMPTDVNATQLTLEISLVNGETYFATSLKIVVVASDNTYTDWNAGVYTYDYSSILPKLDFIEFEKFVVDNAGNAYMIFKMSSDKPATWTFVDFGSVGTVYDDYANVYVLAINSGYYSESKYYDYAKLYIDQGQLKFKIDLGDGNTYYVANPEDWIISKTYSKDRVSIADFVPEVLMDDQLDESILTYNSEEMKWYWNLSKATSVAITLPVKDGLWWNTVTFNDGNTSDSLNYLTHYIDYEFVGKEDSTDFGTKLTLIATALDTGEVYTSVDYSRKDFVDAVMDGGIYNGIGLISDAEEAEQVFRFYTDITKYMDAYKVTIVASDATGVDNDDTNGPNDKLIIWLQFKSPATIVVESGDVSNNIKLDLSKFTATVDATSDSDTIDLSDQSVTATLTYDETTDTYTATFTIDLGSYSALSGGEGDESAQVDIPIDGIQFKLLPEGFTNGFWITNFDAAINIR